MNKRNIPYIATAAAAIAIPLALVFVPYGIVKHYNRTVGARKSEAIVAETERQAELSKGLMKTILDSNDPNSCVD